MKRFITITLGVFCIFFLAGCLKSEDPNEGVPTIQIGDEKIVEGEVADDVQEESEMDEIGNDEEPVEEKTEASPEPTVTEIVNPASVFCEENKGTHELREVPGGEIGVCVFESGVECEEWEYFRGDCSPEVQVPPEEIAEDVELVNPASEFCERKGGTIELRELEDGAQEGICVLPTGKECEEWALLRGECDKDAERKE